ncbi:MAG: PHB depolymerase family esterase [Betaproteobacteria bacterium]
MNMKKYIAVAPLLLLIATAGAAPLPQLNIDKAQTTVSGVSSGGYMAVQLHVAYSSVFRKGAGVVAGGPYNCAESSVLSAISRCLGKSSIPVADLVKTTNEWAKAGAIDATSNLAASKVYIFTGAKDSVVGQSTSTDLQAYYLNYLPPANVVLKKDIEAEHAVVTDDYGATCTTKASPFINNCGFDMAGAMLQHLYGPLAPRGKTADGTLTEFDQSTFVTGHGMGASGWVYVPKTCAAGAKCRVHVALHGCKQNVADVGQEFVRNAGFNRWADANNIVVLYPQTGAKAVNSCWDWWGYDDPNYAKKSAPQMTAIVAMVEQLSAGATAAKSAPPAVPAKETR